jgi:DNA-binding Lrp family transcriptional regulator
MAHVSKRSARDASSRRDMAEDAPPAGVTLHSPDVQRASAGLKFIDNAKEHLTAAAIDEIDQALIDQLLADGKITNRQLAQRIGVSESAVSFRLRKLTKTGVLVFTAIIDWEAAGFEWMIICRIKTRIRSPHDVAEEIGVFPQCEAVAVALGSYDVLGYFLVTDRAELRDLTDKLATVTGVAELDLDLATDTAVPQQGRRLFLSRNTPPIRLPAPKVELDDLDIEILQALIEDGRQSSRNIARKFDVSEGTVRARVARLTQSGLLRVVAMVEPLALGLIGVIASVSIRADRSRLHSIFKELAEAPNVVLAAVCLGSWDLHTAVTARTSQELIGIVSAIQAVDGVLATDTSLRVDVVRLSPYMKRLDAAD